MAMQRMNCTIIEQRHPDSDRATQELKRVLFTEAFVRDVATTLVVKLCVLGSEDLGKWEDDPVAFVEEEEADQYEFSLRVCIKTSPLAFFLML